MNVICFVCYPCLDVDTVDVKTGASCKICGSTTQLRGFKTDLTVVGAIRKFADEHAFLSNFYHHPFNWHNQRWLNSEAAYQSQKSENLSVRKSFCHLSGAEAKRKGRALNRRPDWDDVKIDVMRSVLKAKFKVTALRELLLATGSAYLCEGNHWNDQFWGVCPASSQNGQNHLGRILMEVRDSLQS